MNRMAFISALAITVFGASAAAQQPAANVQPKPTPARRLAFSHDGKSLAVAYGGVDTLVVWDLAARQPRIALHEKAVIHSVAYSPAGDLLAIGVGPMAKLLDPKTGEVRREFNAHQQTVNGVAFTPDGKQLATAGADAQVKLWDVATGGDPLQTFSGPNGPTVNAALSPDGKWLAAACAAPDGIHVWNFQRPTEKPRKFDMSGADGNRRADTFQVVFSPDGRLLAIPDWNGSLSVIDIASGNETFKFKYLNGERCVAFSPDGKWLAVAPGYDRRIKLVSFEQSSGAGQNRQIAGLIQQFHDDDYAKREAASQQLAALGPMVVEQLRANLNSPDAEVRVRCRRLMERILDLAFARQLIGHEAEATWVAFAPDGKLLASGDAQGIVKLWTIPEGKEVLSL
ncbi:MAG TPA: WD40 repeat domain-containing protein, partial [Pirellulales bacterium]|nr:WD40 repeat domain-containing protein [Pirellulales bacterium]